MTSATVIQMLFFNFEFRIDGQSSHMSIICMGLNNEHVFDYGEAVS